MNTFNLSLDLDKSYTGEPVRLRQGDKRGTVIRAAIYDHGEPFTGSYTARYVQAIAGTGHEYYRADATFAAGVATVTVNEEYAAAVAGNTYGYFQFVSGSTVIASTQSFPVIVLKDATAEAEVGEKYDSAIEDALAELDEATGRIAQMVIDATAEYLEAHPELTTTVEDNSLTDAKLIQKGGILSREQWLETMLPNIPRKTTSEADVHSVTDSAGGGPLGITVYGRSTQDGTPTPDAPVPIVSVGPDSDGGVKLVAQRTSDTSQSVTITIDLGGRSLRSLPDGTRDEVTVDEWGHAVLTQRVGEATIVQSDANAAYSYANLGTYSRAVIYLTGAQKMKETNNVGFCDMAPWLASYTADSIHAYATPTSGGSVVAGVFATGASAVEVANKFVGAKLYYPLATPVTIDLGYLDPALLPAPDLTAYVVPSAPSVLRYGFDVAAALAEIATS